MWAEIVMFIVERFPVLDVWSDSWQVVNICRMLQLRLAVVTSSQCKIAARFFLHSTMLLRLVVRLWKFRLDGDVEVSIDILWCMKK